MTDNQPYVTNRQVAGNQCAILAVAVLACCVGGHFLHLAFSRSLLITAGVGDLKRHRLTVSHPTPASQRRETRPGDVRWPAGASKQGSTTDRYYCVVWRATLRHFTPRYNQSSHTHSAAHTTLLGHTLLPFSSRRLRVDNSLRPALFYELQYSVHTFQPTRLVYHPLHINQFNHVVLVFIIKSLF